MQITKLILPVVIGAVLGMLLTGGGEVLIHYLFPLPPGTDINNPASLEAAMKSFPNSAFVCLLMNYTVASLVAGMVATLMAKRETAVPALVIGIVLTLAGLFNVMTIWHPTWFRIANLLVYIPFAYLGYAVVRRKATISAS